MRYGFLFFCAVAAMVSITGEARADAIDGDWCSLDARHFSIRGPNITTPGGTEMTGEYDRHGFAYTIPEGEDNAGHRVVMVLINDDLLHLTVLDENDGGAGAFEEWRRCEVIS